MPYENYGLRNKVLLAIPEFYLHSRPGSGNLKLSVLSLKLGAFDERKTMDKNVEREAYWREHVGAWRASGESQKTYCDRQGLKNHSLSYWHLRLR